MIRQGFEHREPRGFFAIEHLALQAHNLGCGMLFVDKGPFEREVTDLYFDWARAREVDEDGVVLVRPDKHIAWRSQSMVADPQAALASVLSAVLGRTD